MKLIREGSRVIVRVIGCGGKVWVKKVYRRAGTYARTVDINKPARKFDDSLIVKATIKTPGYKPTHDVTRFRPPARWKWLCAAR